MSAKRTLLCGRNHVTKSDLQSTARALHTIEHELAHVPVSATRRMEGRLRACACATPVGFHRVARPHRRRPSLAASSGTIYLRVSA